jgi:hypothetical protein
MHKSSSQSSLKRKTHTQHKYHPISLLDYKMVMRVWANRLGPILAKKIGLHQQGFIPGREGRENIRALLSIVYCNNKIRAKVKANPITSKNVKHLR